MGHPSAQDNVREPLHEMLHDIGAHLSDNAVCHSQCYLAYKLKFFRKPSLPPLEFGKRTHFESNSQTSSSNLSQSPCKRYLSASCVQYVVNTKKEAHFSEHFLTSSGELGWATCPDRLAYLSRRAQRTICNTMGSTAAGCSPVTFFGVKKNIVEHTNLLRPMATLLHLFKSRDPGSTTDGASRAEPAPLWSVNVIRQSFTNSLPHKPGRRSQMKLWI